MSYLKYLPMSNTKIAFFYYYNLPCRVINFAAGVLLIWIAILQNDSTNVCVWRVCFGLNSFVALLVAANPRITGDFQSILTPSARVYCF